MNIDDELRARANVLRANPERWMQGEPEKKNQHCLVYAGNGTMHPRRALSVEAELWLSRWLYRWLNFPDDSDDAAMLSGGMRKVSLTAYNDMHAETVYDVIEMLEKAAGDYV